MCPRRSRSRTAPAPAEQLWLQGCSTAWPYRGCCTPDLQTLGAAAITKSLLSFCSAPGSAVEPSEMEGEGIRQCSPRRRPRRFSRAGSSTPNLSPAGSFSLGRFLHSEPISWLWLFSGESSSVCNPNKCFTCELVTLPWTIPGFSRNGRSAGSGPCQGPDISRQ